MRKISLDVWIQLLGMIGIIVSLIFVALQMRQSHQRASCRFPPLPLLAYLYSLLVRPIFIREF